MKADSFLLCDLYYLFMMTFYDVLKYREKNGITNGYYDQE